MKITRKLAAVMAVFLLSICLFSATAYAAPEDESAPTDPPVESTTTPEDDFVIGTLPPGTGTVVDVFADENGRKFYTIQTPAGNTFYLIIDFAMTGENVYFLDAVQEKDLLALAEKVDAQNPGGENTGSGTNNTASETPGNQTDPEAEPKDNTQNLIMFGVIVLVLIVGGTVYFIKSRRAKKSIDTRDEYEADEPDEYIPDDYETEPEDDLPPWEDDEE